VATLKKYDLAGKEIGTVDIEDAVLKTSANSQMIKDYLVAIRNNARQWSASTKSRAEVAHSGQKPHPQKGTGRARQGYLGAPQYKGGGRVGAPRPKFDQHVSINRKEKQAAIRHLLSEKIQNEQVIILQCGQFKQPKTKKVADFLKGRGLQGKRLLILGALAEAKTKDNAFILSMRNIPKTEFIMMPNASGYDIARVQHIVLLEGAVPQLLKIMQKDQERK
jgi:large subunit ribosomal protein L4